MEGMNKTNMADEATGFWQHYKIDISLAVLGAFILSPLAAYSMRVGSDVYRDYVCGASRYLSEGLALRKAAIELSLQSPNTRAIGEDLTTRILQLHEDANERLEAASACGSPKAIAQMGHAYCFGFGMNRPNPGRGREMAQEALRRDPGLAEWILSSGYCPENGMH
jgi:hypothetical protein